MKDLKIVYVPTEKLIPYARNPRKNEQAINSVAASIKEFGFLVPIVVDESLTIIAGHTRLAAALKLGIERVPTIWGADLTESQIKAFRILDNKVSEKADWDFELLQLELAELPDFDFEVFDVEFIPLELGINEEGIDGLDFENESIDNNKVVVHFPNNQARKAFAELVEQPITDKTRFIWFGNE